MFFKSTVRKLTFLMFFALTFFLSGISSYAQSARGQDWQCVGTDIPNSYECKVTEELTTVEGTITQTTRVVLNKTKTQAEIEAHRAAGGTVTVQQKPAKGCSLWPSSFSLTDCLTDIFNLIFTKILQLINWLLGNILWLSSFIFDFTVYFTIVKFKTNFADLTLGSVGGVSIGGLILGNSSSTLIYYLWGIIRDLLNIIIFILIVYSAVRSMFDGFDSTKNKFIGLLLFSIVANFSLLAVKVAIDISNILALQAYTLAVKPKSTESFWQFRDVGGTGVRSYGEYIMNSVDLDKLTNEAISKNVATEAIKDMKNTFFFQLGRMMTFIGIIYILLYMTGVLAIRAAYLVLAMIISPLIAFNLFFTLMKTSEDERKLADQIGGKLDSIKNNFYDALIKGPLLIFAVFLIGVFAESILGQGVYTMMADNLSRMSDVRGVTDSSFTKSIFVLFKFAIFMALSYAIFKQINEFSVSKKSGTAARKYGAKLANFAFGRGISGLSRIGGAVGRNTIGRSANNPNSVLGRISTTLNNKSEAWKGSEFFVKKGAARLAGGISRSLQGGTYDLRNSRLANSGLASKIKSNIDEISGDKKVGLDFGKAASLGYKESLEKRVGDSKKNIQETIDSAGKNLQATAEQIRKANIDTKVKDADMSVSRFDELMSDPKFKKQLAENPAGIDLSKSGITAADLKILTGAVNKDPEILNKIDSSRTDVEKEIDKQVKKSKKEIQDKIKGEMSASIKPDATLMEKITRTGSTYGELFEDVLTGNRSKIQESVADSFKKKAKEETSNEIKEKIKKFSVVAETKRDLDSELREVNAGITYLNSINGPLNQKEKIAFDTAYKRLSGIKVSLEKNIAGIDIKPGNPDAAERIRVVDSFSSNKALRDEILTNKVEASDLLTSIYDKSSLLSPNISSLKKAAELELDTLNLSRPPAGSSQNAIRAHVRATKDAKERFDFYDNLSKNAFKNALDISERANKIKERIEAQFEPKK